MPSVSAAGSPGEWHWLDFDYPENSVISLPSLKSFQKVGTQCVLARVLPGFQIHLGVIKWKNNPVHSERGKEFLKTEKGIGISLNQASPFTSTFMPERSSNLPWITQHTDRVQQRAAEGGRGKLRLALEPCNPWFEFHRVALWREPGHRALAVVSSVSVPNREVTITFSCWPGQWNHTSCWYGSHSQGLHELCSLACPLVWSGFPIKLAAHCHS